MQLRLTMLSHPVRLINQRHALNVVPRPGGIFVIGATTSESDRGETVTLRGHDEPTRLAVTDPRPLRVHR